MSTSGETNMVDTLYRTRQMMGWHVPQPVMRWMNQERGEKKEIYCFRCKKTKHYLKECEEELLPKTNKKGSIMMIMDEESSDKAEDNGQYEEISRRSIIPIKMN